MRYVVDTHALVWHMTNDRRLGPQARHILDDDSAGVIVPSIVLAEAKHIADRKRIPLTFQHILDEITASPNAIIFPFDEFVINRLPDNMEIHDGMIIATVLYCQDAFEEPVALLTNDIAITQSNLVPVIW